MGLAAPGTGRPLSRAARGPVGDGAPSGYSAAHRLPANAATGSSHMDPRPEDCMFRSVRFALPFALLALLTTSGCATLKTLTDLRNVTFAFTGVSDVKLAGIAVGPGADYSKLGLADVARLTAALVSKQAPVDMIMHVSATNPTDNRIPARIADIAWTLYVEDHRTLDGNLGSPVSVGSGSTLDIPLAAHFDLVSLGASGARDLFDLAVAIAGQGTVKKDLRLEMVPTIETSLGPMRYPQPIVVHRLGSTH